MHIFLMLANELCSSLDVPKLFRTRIKHNIKGYREPFLLVAMFLPSPAIHRRLRAIFCPSEVAAASWAGLTAAATHGAGIRDHHHVCV